MSRIKKIKIKDGIYRIPKDTIPKIKLIEPKDIKFKFPKFKKDWFKK